MNASMHESSAASGNVVTSNVVTSHIGRLKYVLIMPVWGDHHTGLFLRFCVPFLLTEGNVGAFPNRRLRVIVMSRRADFVRMNDDANYRRLTELAEVSESEIDGIVDLSLPHRAMTECYLRAVKALDDPDNTVTIFPTPDCFLSRNTLRRIVMHMEAGWRGIMVCGLRVTMEDAAPLLDEILTRSGGAEGLGERELTAVVLKFLHPITLTCDVASNEFMTNWPSHVYWIAPDRDWLVAHCFHLHPLAVRGVPARIDVNTTIDGDYMSELGVSAEELYVCKDSDEFICVEISPKAKRIEARLGRFSKKALVRFSVACNSLHRAFYPQKILWRVSADPKIPEAIRHETEEMNAAVAKGSRYESFRYVIIQLVRRTPILLFIARSIVFIGRRSKRLLFWLSSLVSGSRPAQTR